ncbi:AAA family ATPase [Tritonibacter mobilis]|uniref:AAA family ATPase n=1 Tax=Tritonibacter mobilis TaxID=379347 RepID=UPI0009BCA982|nr:AAA family ATPase [Tritonibacter mobilis]
MRFVNRETVAAPAAFSRPSAKEGRYRLLETFSQDARKLAQSREAVFLDEEAPSNSEAVRKALSELFAGRCAFCEIPVSDPLVYHFRPDGNAEPVEDYSLSHLYYIWLAEAWQNLYPICHGCMPRDPSYFPVKGRRAKLPDVALLQRFAERDDGRWPEFPFEEEAEFLDPCRNEQFWRSLFFRSTGEVVGISRRGRETIQHFNLNRDELLESRRKAINEAISRTESEILGNRWAQPRIDLGHDGACELFLREVLFEALSREGPRDRNRQVTRLARREDAIARFRAAIRETDSRVIEDWPETANAKPSELRAALTSVSVRNFKSLEKIDLDLQLPEPGQSAPALLILGENAIGKSSILEAIALAVMPEAARVKLLVEPAKMILDPSFLGAPRQLAPMEAELRAGFANGTHISVTLSRDPLAQISQTDEVALPVFAYGAYRQYQKGDRNFVAHKHVRSLFHPDELLPNPERWLLKLDESEFDMVARALREVFNIESAFHVLERNNDRIYVVVRPVKTKDGPVLRTPIEFVSSGFRAVLAMLCDTMQGLMDSRVNPDFSSLENSKALVLIDEVEAHLHPRWKMSIMTGLRKALPSVTFIATSHDPLCLRGMKKGEVIVLERVSGDESRTSLPVFTHSLVDLPDNENWTVEQLLTADFFQMHSTESLEAERRAARMEDRLARGATPDEDPELQAYLAEFSADLPIGHTEAHRLVQRAIADFLRERREASDNKLRNLKEETRQSILAALRSIG